MGIEENLTEGNKLADSASAVGDKIQKIKLEVEKLNGMLCGFRLKPIPLDLPQQLTTTELLMNMSDTIDKLIDGYNNFDEQTKEALVQFGDILNNFCDTYDDSIRQLYMTDSRTYEQMTYLTGKINALEKSINTLDGTLKSYVSTGTTTDANLKKQLANVCQEWSGVKSAVNSLQQSDAQQNGKIVNILASIQKMQETIKQSDIYISGLETKINAILEKVNENNEDIDTDLQAQIDALTKAHTTLQTAQNQQLDVLTRLNATVETVAQHQEALEKNVSQWESQIAINNSTVEALKEIVSDLSAKQSQINELARKANVQSAKNEATIYNLKLAMEDIKLNTESFKGAFYFSAEAGRNGDCFKDGDGNKLNVISDNFKSTTFISNKLANMMAEAFNLYYISSVSTSNVRLPIDDINSNKTVNMGFFFRLTSGFHKLRFARLADGETGHTLETGNNSHQIYIVKCRYDVSTRKEMSPVSNTGLSPNFIATARMGFLPQDASFFASNRYAVCNVYVSDKEAEDYVYCFVCPKNDTDSIYVVGIDDDDSYARCVAKLADAYGNEAQTYENALKLGLTED